MELQIVEAKLQDYNESGNGEGWAQNTEMKGWRGSQVRVDEAECGLEPRFKVFETPFD